MRLSYTINYDALSNLFKIDISYIGEELPYDFGKKEKLDIFFWNKIYNPIVESLSKKKEISGMLDMNKVPIKSRFVPEPTEIFLKTVEIEI